MKNGTLLVLGGARSGKSAYAERIVAQSGFERVYLATAEARDGEMAERIAHHRARRGAEWRTIEEPDRLKEVLLREAGEGRAVLVDCLTLWLSNLTLADAAIEDRAQALCRAVPELPGLVVFVSNEIGMGLVPDSALGRRFRDAQGRLNQQMAAIAENVVFIAAGLPLHLKGKSA